MRSLAVAALVAYLGLLAARHPLVRCLAGRCADISAGDAALGLITALDADHTHLTAKDAEEVDALRQHKARLMRTAAGWITYFDSADLRYRQTTVRIPGTRANGNTEVLARVITRWESSNSTSRPLIFFVHGGGMVFGEANGPFIGGERDALR